MPWYQGGGAYHGMSSLSGEYSTAGLRAGVRHRTLV